MEPESKELQTELTDRLVMPWFEEAWIPIGPDWQKLWRLADAQGGFFTNAEARTCGVRRSLLSYYSRRGVFRRFRRGVYRLPWCEPTPLDATRVAWMAAGRQRSVVSHASALFLHGLIDDAPTAVHLTLPRARRGKVHRWEPPYDPPRVELHVPRGGVGTADVTERHGIRVTTAPRSLLDTARYRHGDEGLREAIVRAVELECVETAWLREKARELRGMARRRVEAALRVAAGGRAA